MIEYSVWSEAYLLKYGFVLFFFLNYHYYYYCCNIFKFSKSHLSLLSLTRYVYMTKNCFKATLIISNIGS